MPRTVTKMPDTVRSKVRLHLAETEHALALVKAELAGEAVTAVRSRRLRMRRERLTEEAAAWRHLAGVLVLNNAVCSELGHVWQLNGTCALCGLPSGDGTGTEGSGVDDAPSA